MTDKEKFFKALEDPLKRKLMIQKLKEISSEDQAKESSEDQAKEFEKLTGYDLDEFMFLLEYKKIIIQEINREDNFICRCGATYKIYSKDIEMRIYNDHDPLNQHKRIISNFYCVKCCHLSAIYGEIKKIEINL